MMPLERLVLDAEKRTGVPLMREGVAVLLEDRVGYIYNPTEDRRYEISEFRSIEKEEIHINVALQGLTTEGGWYTLMGVHQVKEMGTGEEVGGWVMLHVLDKEMPDGERTAYKEVMYGEDRAGIRTEGVPGAYRGDLATMQSDLQGMGARAQTFKDLPSYIDIPATMEQFVNGFHEQRFTPSPLVTR